MTKPPERRRAKSALLEAVHDAAVSLHAHGFIDKRRLSSYEALCLEPVPEYSSAQIRALRTSLQLSQRSEEHTSELQSQSNLVCRLLLEKKKDTKHKSSCRSE